jgi:aminoglycoside phosphotransferase (APT) family kinase protein
VPVPTQRDPDETRRVLGAWLTTHVDGAGSVEVTDLTVPSGAGFSNETLVIDVSWPPGHEMGDLGERLVVRLKRSGFQLFLEADFELQYQLLSTLARETPVPVPTPLWYEADPEVLGAPFFVMTYVDGRSVQDRPPYNQAGWLADAPAATREAVWRSAVDALLVVHSVPTGTVSFLAKPELGETGFDQALTYWGRSFEWAAGGRPQPVAEAAWERLTANPPRERDTALSWGDARMGNMLFQGSRVAAVVDWEMMSLGGPVMDLGWWLFLDDYHSFEDPRLPGLGSRADTIALWEAGTGRTVIDLEWYEIFAGFRFANVMMRMAQMFRSWGVERTNLDQMETNNPVTHLLARKLDVPPPGPVLD